MAAPLFYENPVALSPETHRNLKLKSTGEGLKFSGKTNSVVLAGAEFPEACKHFPIVFVKGPGKRLLPAALLGFRDFENLFVDSEGNWKGEYVPAYVRRYPFVPANGPKGQFTVCIDESYPGFSADEGQPLFDRNRQPTDYLKGVLKFLQDYERQLERTDLFLRNLRDSSLLMDVAANVKLPGGERFSMAGMMMVDERKLKALPEATVLSLFRSGELAWIYSHLISIGNFDRLLRRSGARPALAGARPAAGEKPAVPAKPPSSRKGQEQPTRPARK